MAPLPFNNTNVLFVDYNTQGEDHTLLCRFDADDTGADAMTAVDGFLDAISGAIGLTSILGARVQLLGTDVSFDVTWTGATAYGDGIGDHYQSAQFYDWVGRSPGGRRARVAVFGAQNLQNGDDYRSNLGEDAALDAGITFLQSQGSAFLAIDGQVPIWKNYVNMGVNAYWRNKIR